MKIRILVLSAGLAVVAMTISAPWATASYQPTNAQRMAVEMRLAQYGKNFSAGRMFQTGNTHQAGQVAYFYKFGDDTIHWRMEEWAPLPDGAFRVTLYRFYRDTKAGLNREPDPANPEDFIPRANRGIIIVNGRREALVEFEEPAANTEGGQAQENFAATPIVIQKSELALQLLLTGTPNLEPFPIDHH